MASPHERALQSDVPPKTKSDSQWLRDMGYRGGLHDFKREYGFKDDEVDDALRLVGQFRDEQQEEWEALRRKEASASPSRSEEEKRKWVEQAMLWHQRLAHASYHSILALPTAATGVPSFGDLQVRDLPACEFCTSMGTDPFKEE